MLIYRSPENKDLSLWDKLSSHLGAVKEQRRDELLVPLGGFVAKLQRLEVSFSVVADYKRSARKWGYKKKGLEDILCVRNTSCVVCSTEALW